MDSKKCGLITTTPPPTAVQCSVSVGPEVKKAANVLIYLEFHLFTSFLPTTSARLKPSFFVCLFNSALIVILLYNEC